MKGPMNLIQIEQNIKEWLKEDMPYGDVSSQSLMNPATTAEPQLIAKQAGILCGQDVFDLVYRALTDEVQIKWSAKDGDIIKAGQLLATMEGPLHLVLMGERLALNLLQRLSGIATLASSYAHAAEGYDVRIVDTRKTTPGLRQLEKYAVRTGGCYNHRYSLSDAVMIKDNHIRTAGSISEAVRRIRSVVPHTAAIEVEVETISGLKEALACKVQTVMLDNMSMDDMKKAVQLAKGHVLLEASGNISLERIPSVAATGVDIISVGALTHSASALDISLKFH